VASASYWSRPEISLSAIQAAQGLLASAAACEVTDRQRADAKSRR
jgi:hypothetical protein